MGSFSRENEVLKLVYPGGFVEIYRSPITAAQVMKRNPRHCVTRPDVFKFPWIVVRPESVLKPGKVFYVVPYHTIRRLLQSKGHDRDEQEDFSSLGPRPKVTERRYYYPLQHDDDDHQFQRLVKKGNFAMEYSENYKVNIKCDIAAAAEDSPFKYCVGGEEKYPSKFYRKQSVISCQQRDSVVISPKKQQELKKWQNYMSLYVNEQQSEEEEVYLLLENVHKVIEEPMPRAGLKSCLKKHNNNNSIAKSRGLSVRFALDQD